MKRSQPYFVNDDPNDMMIMHTEYTLKVERYLLSSSKDIESSNTVIFKVLGGRTEFVEFIAEDEPTFKVGDRVLLLLTNEQDVLYRGSWHVLTRQGAYNLVDGMAYNQFLRERDMPEDKLVDTILRILASDKK